MGQEYGLEWNMILTTPATLYYNNIFLLILPPVTYTHRQDLNVTGVDNTTKFPAGN